jgi:hypothetical protein
VRLYNDKYELVATHERASKPGERRTHPDHLPPEKLPGLLLDRETCLTEARSIGVSTAQVIEEILSDPVMELLHSAGRLLRLRNRFGEERLEAACQRALAFDDPGYKTVKRILTEGLEQQPIPIPVELPPAKTFARRIDELVGTLAEVVAWN